MFHEDEGNLFYLAVGKRLTDPVASRILRGWTDVGALGCAAVPAHHAGLLERITLDLDKTFTARTHDPQRTRGNILAAATAVFAEKGYAGAKVSDIVDRAQTTKPMIYYHYGSKEGLFAAVLEDVYAGMRSIEQSLRLDGLPAAAAMRRLVEVTFDYHAANPDWVRLIAVANIQGAEQIANSLTIANRNSPVLAILEALLARGAAEGAFRAGLDPLHLHLLINSFCFYRVSNRHTWKVIFSRDLAVSAEAARQRAVVVEAVLRYLMPDPGQEIAAWETVT